MKLSKKWDIVLLNDKENANNNLEIDPACSPPKICCGPDWDPDSCTPDYDCGPDKGDDD